MRRPALLLRLGLLMCLLTGVFVVAGDVDDRAVGVSVPDGGSVFTPMAPQRLVDTRIGLGAPQARLASRESLDVQVTGRLGIPKQATAVVANVIAVEADRPGYLEVLPTGQAAFESSSTLNTDGFNQTIANATFAPLSDSGKLSVYVIFNTDVVIDISGYFTPASTSAAGRLVPLSPTRILDTRISLGWKAPRPPAPTATTTTTTTPTTTPTTTTPTPAIPPNPGNSKNCADFSTYSEAKAWFDFYYPYYRDVARLDSDGDLIPCESLLGRFAAQRSALVDRVAAGTTITLKVAGRGGVPEAGVSAVVMNVTAADAAALGYVQVAPTPVVKGATSSLNLAPGRTVANLVVVPLGSGGSVDLYTITQVDLIADVVGYFTDETASKSGRGRFVPIPPNRQLDSREQRPDSPLPGGTVTSIDVRDISPDAIAIAGNLTATEPIQPGYLQLAAPPLGLGGTSNLNMSYQGQTIANAVVSPVASGRLELYNLHPTHEILDVTGWFTSTAPPPPTTTAPTTTIKATTTTTPKATTTSTTQAATTTTLPSEPDPRIAFTRANQIYTINPDGTGEVKLTSADKNYWPRWSPNGDRIAFVHEVAGAQSLWVMNADGTNKQQVTDANTAFGPDWSPDGQWLAFVGAGQALSRVRSSSPFGTAEAFLGGDDPSFLESFGAFGTPAWSAANDEIYFYTPQGFSSPDHYIQRYDVSTQDLDDIFAIGGACCGSGTVAEPAIASGGNVIGFTITMTGEGSKVWLLPYSPETGFLYLSSASPFATLEEDSQLAFSHTDTRVALMNDAGGSPQIFITNRDGSNREPLTNGYQPDWQPIP